MNRPELLVLRRRLLRHGAAAFAAPWLLQGPAGATQMPPKPAEEPAVQRGRTLHFPRDHGAHLTARTEWWYLTGWLSADGSPAEPSHGFQVTFFRSRTGLAPDIPSRFAARHLLFAHAAISSLRDGRHQHDQRIARWSGAPGAVLGAAAEDDAQVRLGPWSLSHDDPSWRARVPAQGFELDLKLTRSQDRLLQGEAGYSRKGPLPTQASHYVSEPQLAVQGRIVTDGRALQASGRAWMDHEWSDEILDHEAVGWDWMGINLLDGGALTAFRLRRADGSALWAGGSLRAAGGPVRSFGPDELRFEPGRSWLSPATGARYPVQWRIHTPQGEYTLRSLLDAQELDSRASTGTVYWEGLSELLDSTGRRVGLGYLEMTGYAARLQLR